MFIYHDTHYPKYWDFSFFYFAPVSVGIWKFGICNVIIINVMMVIVVELVLVPGKLLSEAKGM